MGVRELFVEAMRCERAGLLDDAVSAYVAAARVDPKLRQSYERLLDIHLHRRELDAAWCAVSMLAVLDRLDQAKREIYEDHVPRRLRPLRAPLDDDAWQRVRDPAEDPAASATLGAMARELAPPMDARRVDGAALAWAATALGVREADVPYAWPPLEPYMSLDEERDGLPLRQRLFFAGREAASLVAAQYALGRRGSLPAIEAKRATKPIDGLALAPDDLVAWVGSVRRTRARAGLLVCGEPRLAHDVLVAEGLDVDAWELAAFVVSPEHHRLRGRLGIAVGMGADAPA